VDIPDLGLNPCPGRLPLHSGREHIGIASVVALVAFVFQFRVRIHTDKANQSGIRGWTTRMGLSSIHLNSRETGIYIYIKKNYIYIYPLSITTATLNHAHVCAEPFEVFIFSVRAEHHGLFGLAPVSTQKMPRGSTLQQSLSGLGYI